MKEFITFLVKQFVANPDVVSVDESVEQNIHVFQINVAETDIGMVIGKQGKTINSIRNLAKAKAIKDNIMIKVVLADLINSPQIETDPSADSPSSQPVNYSVANSSQMNPQQTDTENIGKKGSELQDQDA